MANVPFQVVVAAYHGENRAGEMAQELLQAKYANRLYYKNIAVIRKDAQGKAHIKETGDMGGGLGASLGAVVGGAFGLLLGPAGLVAGAGAGAVIGGAGAALHDAGIPNERLDEIGDVLPAGSSAIVAIFEDVEVDDKERREEIERSTAEFVEKLAADIGSNLAEGKDVAYTVSVTDQGVAASRSATGEAAADISTFILIDEGESIDEFPDLDAAPVDVADDHLTYAVGGGEEAQ